MAILKHNSFSEDDLKITLGRTKQGDFDEFDEHDHIGYEHPERLLENWFPDVIEPRRYRLQYDFH